MYGTAGELLGHGDNHAHIFREDAAAEGATDELLYWFSRLSREKRFSRERLDRREYTTREHLVSLRSFALSSSRETTPESNASPAHAS